MKRARPHGGSTALPCHTTYAQSNGERPYDWNRALATVKPTQYSRLSDMSVRAGQWVTCACGNQCELIPRYRWVSAFSPHMDGEPLDDTLSTLGYAFNDRVRDLKDAAIDGVPLRSFNAARKRAQSCLARIEARSGVLIRGIIKDAARKEVAS